MQNTWQIFLFGCAELTGHELWHRQLLGSPYPQTLSHLDTGQNKCYGNILLQEISVIVGHFDCKHLCLVKKNVPIAIILPSRWQVGAETPKAHQSEVFQNSPKSCQLFGFPLVKILFPGTLKNRPIWSHLKIAQQPALFS